ncbi:type VI secretion system-associated FHA domain protein TagH [Candidatus Thiodictyon syntrophicum]|uniref:FHA domain-containing protein n=1 Tax=Candidatus Thiodictyon syntrophicum TaxID=1166950 RepID=A0A2K8U7D9_9GAMM|nr:type VI secretion system-associated FHA domain protein TagH [Candidatus Thiodictyon syntrophicum]AUB81500.1 hypothetical protein THSYN_11415 [Candidatus Thiodictyon syntrophicum]
MTSVILKDLFANAAGHDMAYRITIARWRGAAPAAPTTLAIAGGGCTIGRNPDNDLSLSDSERVISGRHAHLALRDDALWVTDLSTNGTFLNQSTERLPAHQPVRLAAGDTLSVGPYDLVIEADDGRAGAAAAVHADPFEPPAPQGPPGGPGRGASPDILDLLEAGNPTDPTDPTAPSLAPVAPRCERAAAPDPFADALALDPFLAGAAAPAAAALATPPPTPLERVHLRPPEIGPAVAGPAPGGPAVPDDYDLLADALGGPVAEPGAAAPPGRPRTDPFAAFAEQDFGAPGPFSSLPPMADPFAAGAAAPAGPELAPPPLAPWSAPTPARPLSPPTAPTDPSPAPAAGTAPDPVPLPTPQAPPDARPGTSPGAAADTGLAAFLAGLGTGDARTIADPNRFLHDAGRLLRALAQGLTTTMQSRAQFKNELRLGVTTIRAADNNPFKFSVDVDEALERLLLRPGGGFLGAPEAARGAFEDVQAHEMAMIAGLRAALRALLARFEPAALERCLGAASGLDKLLPMARRSRYWELFTEVYDQVAADAAEDFMELFGDAFTRAYEDQIQRLIQARRQTPAAPGRGRDQN